MPLHKTVCSCRVGVLDGKNQQARRWEMEVFIHLDLTLPIMLVLHCSYVDSFGERRIHLRYLLVWNHSVYLIGRLSCGSLYKVRCVLSVTAHSR